MHKKWRLNAQFGEEKKVLVQIHQLFPASVPYRERVDDMVTAIAEACLNAFEHGNGMRAGSEVCVHMNRQDDEICVRVYDEGAGFEYTPDKARQRLENPPDLNHTPARGWGMLIISNLADKVSTGLERHKFYLEMQFVIRERAGHAGKSNYHCRS